MWIVSENEVDHPEESGLPWPNPPQGEPSNVRYLLHPCGRAIGYVHGVPALTILTSLDDVDHMIQEGLAEPGSDRLVPEFCPRCAGLEVNQTWDEAQAEAWNNLKAEFGLPE
jgi:hypothetical protein